MNNSIDSNCRVTNREVKVLLINHFGDKVRFLQPQKVNKSLMFFGHNLKSRRLGMCHGKCVCISVVKTLRRDISRGYDLVNKSFLEALGLGYTSGCRALRIVEKTARGKRTAFLPAEAASGERKQNQSSAATALPQRGVGDAPSTFLCQQLV